MAKGLNGVKREEWRRRLAKFDASSLSVVEFCRREQVSQASFYYWSKRISGRDRLTTDELQRVDAGTGGSAGAAPNVAESDCVEVFVGNAIRVRMPAGDPAAVAALVHQLQRAAQQRTDALATTSRFQRIELT